MRFMSSLAMAAITTTLLVGAASAEQVHVGFAAEPYPPLAPPTPQETGLDGRSNS